MIYNLGSINADYIYAVPHLVQPGETLAATGLRRELGGKGANQSVAAARAGSKVVHIGAVGADGDWAVSALGDYGVETSHIATVDAPTAHAIIQVDTSGENAIVIYPGANQKQSLNRLKMALRGAGPDDILLLQNETDLQGEAARLAQDAGATVIYSAAPFCPDATVGMLPLADILVLNAVEAEQLTTAMGQSVANLPVRTVIVTKGVDGADWCEDGRIQHMAAPAVTAVDTTGAGDCFLGYVAAALDQGLQPEEAMRLGATASALQVQRPGTASAIPDRAEVDAYLASDCGRADLS